MVRCRSATALKSLPIDVPRAPWQRKAVAKVDGKADEEAPPDYFNLLSMALGMLGFYFKVGIANAAARALPAVVPELHTCRVVVMCVASVVSAQACAPL